MATMTLRTFFAASLVLILLAVSAEKQSADQTGIPADALAIQEAEVALNRSYAGKLATVLPAAKVARYIQIENKIRALVRFELADQIPLVK